MKEIAKSIRQRLLNLAKAKQVDYYDVYMILEQQNLDNEKLADAVKSTFHARDTVFEANHPLFSDAFAKDKNRIIHWKNFLKKIKAPDLEFSTVMESIVERLYPIYCNLEITK